MTDLQDMFTCISNDLARERDRLLVKAAAEHPAATLFAVKLSHAEGSSLQVVITVYSFAGPPTREQMDEYGIGRFDSYWYERKDPPGQMVPVFEEQP